MTHATTSRQLGRGAATQAAPASRRTARALTVSWPLLLATVSLLIFVAGFALSRTGAVFDLPLMRAINAPAGRSIAFDRAIYDLDHYASLSGVVFMSLVCACWFAEADADKRARILAGALLAFPTGAVSRLLQHVLPTHSRPFYEAAATFRPPAVFNRPYTTWNCFPSDHATVFGALVLVIWMARPRLGLLVTPWFLLVEFSRMYMGEHYPSDILGGFALAGFLICAVQDRRVVALSRRGVAWAEAHPGLFYGAGFFLAYQIATLFFDPRDMVGGLSLAHLR